MGSISVLLPTRLRHGPLARSIESLRDNADEDFELLLAVDEDDPTDYSDYEHVMITPRFGYARLHCYYNLLAPRATGDWLMVWNDDAVMTTPHWDSVVREHPLAEILSLDDPPHKAAGLCTFPLVPRRFVEAIGHFSLSNHNDTWWQQIGEWTGTLVWIPVRVRHERADLTGMNRDSVFEERVYRSQEFEGPELKGARQEDAEIVRRLLREVA